MAPDPPMSPCDPDGDSVAHTATTAAGDDPEAPSPSLVKSVAQLASGRAIAAAVTVLATPIVTRLYDETAFGILGLVTAIAMLLYPFTNGFCYVLAMPLATSVSERRALLVLSVVLGLVATVLVAVITLAGGGWIAIACGKEELGKYLFFVPLFCLCSTFASSTTMALNCRKKFGHVAVRMTVEGITRRGVQIGAALAGLGGSAAGLLLGSLSAACAGTLTFSVVAVKPLWHADGKPFRIAQLIHAAAKYKDFPRFRLWSESLIHVTNNFPMLFLGFFFSSVQIAGCYAVARTLLLLPLRLFTETSRQVFYVEAAEKVARGESAAAATSQLLRLLSVFTAFPLTTVFVLGPLLFEVALGSRWHEAGVYARILAPGVAILAIGQPLSAMFDATSRMAEGLLYNIGLLVTQAVLMFLGAYFFGARTAMACYTIGTVLVWGYILARTLGLARVGRIRAARLLVAPYIEAILLLVPTGVLYGYFEWRIPALVALAVACVVQAVIIHVRYPQIRRKLTSVLSRRRRANRQQP